MMKKLLAITAFAVMLAFGMSLMAEPQLDGFENEVHVVSNPNSPGEESFLRDVQFLMIADHDKGVMHASYYEVRDDIISQNLAKLDLQTAWEDAFGIPYTCMVSQSKAAGHEYEYCAVGVYDKGPVAGRQFECEMTPKARIQTPRGPRKPLYHSYDWVQATRWVSSDHVEVKSWCRDGLPDRPAELTGPLGDELGRKPFINNTRNVVYLYSPTANEVFIMGAVPRWATNYQPKVKNGQSKGCNSVLGLRADAQSTITQDDIIARVFPGITEGPVTYTGSVDRVGYINTQGGNVNEVTNWTQKTWLDGTQVCWELTMDGR